jgi:hypothetical protein
MKRTIAVLAFVMLLGPLASRASAQTLNITNIDNKTAGQITGSGNWTVPCGATIKGIDFLARPSGGGKGQGGKKDAFVDTCAKTWSASVVNLPTGTYDVQAVMRYRSGGVDYYYYSATTANVKVQ